MTFFYFPCDLASHPYPLTLDMTPLLDRRFIESTRILLGWMRSDWIEFHSSAPFRYDPNDLSMDDGEESGSPRSAIKNLNFSTVARESMGARNGGSASSFSRDSGSATSVTTRSGFSPDWMREAAGEFPASASSSSGAVASQGVLTNTHADIPRLRRAGPVKLNDIRRVVCILLGCAGELKHMNNVEA